MKTIFYIIAPTSSGKTTSALRLSKEMNLPIFHADTVYDLLHKEYKTIKDSAFLTRYELWGDPKNFGIPSWGKHEDMNSAKLEMYEKLLSNAKGSFIIEGFTLSFIDERNLVKAVIGNHKAILLRINMPYSDWLTLFKRKFRESKIPEAKSYSRLVEAFEVESSDELIEFKSPSEISKSNIEANRVKGSPAMKNFILGFPGAVKNGAFLETSDLAKRLGVNTGNLAFQYAVQNQIVNIRDILDIGAPINGMDLHNANFIIPAANQLGVHTNHEKRAKIVAETEANFIMIGLGAQQSSSGSIPEISKGTASWIHEIGKKSCSCAPNISVRGEFTFSTLKSIGLEKFAVVLGCPSLFINSDPELGQKIAANVRPIKRVAVPAGRESWKHLRHIEASLARIVTATHGSYVGQHALPMMQLTRGEARLMDEADLRACRDYACPEMDLEEFTRWSERHGNLFFDVQSWMEHYRRFDFVIGARIHGVMLALQAGIPGVVVAHDSRTLELCQTMMVPYVLAKDVQQGITREQLPDLFKFDAKAFDENRRALAKRYVEFLESNELTPVNWLKGLAA